MRILFSSPSAVGHIHTMLPLAQQLQTRGHEVRWATGLDNTGRLDRAGIQSHPAGLAHATMMAVYHSRYPEADSLPPKERRPHMLAKMFGAVATAPMLADMLQLTESWCPDLLVHDAIEFAAAIVATKIGAPHVTHSFGAIVPTELVRLAATEVAALWAGEGLTPDPLAGAYQHLYLDIYPPSMQLPDIVNAGRRQLLRPVTADVVGGGESPESPVRRGPRPLIYLTFGTVQNRASALHSAVTALAALEVDLLVTIGSDRDPAEFGPQPPNVRLERYVAQALILDHCALVVSHAGSGTLLAALARGIPHLCLPQAADQFVNSAAASAAGAAIGLAPADAEPAAIAAAAHRLLDENSFRAAAAAIASEIAAMPDSTVAAEVALELVG